MSQLGYLLVAIAVLATPVAVHRVNRRRRLLPRRPPGQPERTLMPRSASISGLVLVGVGTITFIASLWNAHLPGALLGFAGAVAGVVIAMHAQNWYAIVDIDHVEWRDVWGRVHTLWFDEITRYERWTNFGQRYVAVWGPEGRSFRASETQFNLDPLIDAIEYHAAYGVWPVRGSIPVLPEDHEGNSA